MRKTLVSVLGVLAILMGAFAFAPAAQADDTDPAPIGTFEENSDYGADYVPKPSDINGNMFWTGNVCIQSPLNATTYPVAAMAQQINLRVANTNVVAINFRADCEAAGYPPSRSMTISTTTLSGTCTQGLNLQKSLYNGMYRWTSHPVMFINSAPSAHCVETQTRRNHIISASIAYFMGLKFLNSSGWNSRVMNMTPYSWDNVPVITQPEGDRLWSIYTRAYGG